MIKYPQSGFLKGKIKNESLLFLQAQEQQPHNMMFQNPIGVEKQSQQNTGNAHSQSLGYKNKRKWSHLETFIRILS